MTDHPFEQTTHNWPQQAQDTFATLRTLILAAAKDASAGEIEESLKWRQPAWRPKAPRTGSTLRVNWSAASPLTIALFVDCKTTLAAEMFAAYPYDFQYEANRAMRLDLGAALPKAAISHLAQRTFTYHRKA